MLMKILPRSVAPGLFIALAMVAAPLLIAGRRCRSQRAKSIVRTKKL